MTPQDGTSLGLFLDTLTLGKVLGGPGEFDPLKLAWIGRIVSTATVSVVWHTSPVQSIEAAKQKEIVIAASVPSNSSSFIPTALNDSDRHQIQDHPRLPRVAADGAGDGARRGPCDRRHELQMTKPDWLAERKVRVLYAQGAHRIKELPNDPGLLDFAVDEVAEDSRPARRRPRHRPLDRGRARHPSRARAVALRKAFMATMADAEFVADMRKRNLNIEPLSGEDVQKTVEAAVATPRELVEQAKRYAGQ